MTMGPHAKMVDHFARVMAAAGGADAGSVRALARAVGLPATSVQDMVVALERLGFLARGVTGRVERGQAALETGLSAGGFGDSARFLEPVLETLRFQAGSTAFAGLLEAGRLHLVLAVGPLALRLRARPITAPGVDSPAPWRHDDLTLEVESLAEDAGRRLVVGLADTLSREGLPDQVERRRQALDVARRALSPPLLPRQNRLTLASPPHSQ